MTKSVIFLAHVAFWMIMLTSLFAMPFSARFITPEEYGKVMIYIKLLAPLFFYIGYFGVLTVTRRKVLIIYGALFLILAYLIIFFVSKKVFAFSIAPLYTLTLWFLTGCFFRFFIDWFKKRDEKNMLEKQNIESKLALLRIQINPHFLFNTLHNIDTLIPEDKVKASSALIKLSDIMRYMLHDNQRDKVYLEKEIEYIENYIALERLRLKNQGFVSFKIEGDYEHLEIAPMIFIPFIENAFKHCRDTDIENGINITFLILGNQINFTCENQYEQIKYEKDQTSGIGLDSVEERLNLLYPKKHKLDIRKSDNFFKVNLMIQLHDN